jgi:hypothetical protein
MLHDDHVYRTGGPIDRWIRRVKKAKALKRKGEHASGEIEENDEPPEYTLIRCKRFRRSDDKSSVPPEARERAA